MAAISASLAQALWALLLGVVAAFWLSRGLTGFGLLLLAALPLYAFVIVMLYRGRAWAWWLCWLPSIASLALAGPNVIYNFVLFLSDDPLYLDSPGTILIVAVNAILFVVAPMVIAMLLLWSRKQLPSNNALLTDAHPSALRASSGTAKRER